MNPPTPCLGEAGPRGAGLDLDGRPVGPEQPSARALWYSAATGPLGPATTAADAGAGSAVIEAGSAMARASEAESPPRRLLVLLLAVLRTAGPFLKAL